MPGWSWSGVVLAYVAVVFRQAEMAVPRIGAEVVAAGRGACSAERRDRAEPRERGRERIRPGPIAIELEMGASPVTHELGGDMQQPLAKAFGFGGGELAGQADQLGPAEQVLGDQ